MDRVDRRVVPWVAAAACALVVATVLVAVRGEPRFQSDQGVFLSVAARMLDGDRLYADVVDNKDPLFFYTYALALGIGGWKAPFALDGVWLLVAAVSVGLLLRELRAPAPAVATGLLVYPLSLTAGWYEPGLSMLAALSIAPLAAWLWLRARFAGAGAALGVAMLFKLNLAPVVAAPLVAFLVLNTPTGSRLQQAVRSLLGLAATLGLTAAALAVRGELAPYLETIGNNVGYSSRVLGADGPVDAVEGHLRVVREYFLAAGKWQAPAAALAVAVFICAVAAGWRRLRSRSLHPLAAAATAALAATLATLALTAVWAHHLQMLAYAAVLMAATCVALASLWLGQAAAVVAAVALVLFAGWASARPEVRTGISVSEWSVVPFTEPAASLNAARARYYPGEDRVPYMVFGGVSENAHAAFTDDELDLACRWFHLYPFSREKQFAETLDCLDEMRPELVLVTLGFFDPAPPSPWAAFVADARRALGARYRKVSEVYPGFQVWKRREAR